MDSMMDIKAFPGPLKDAEHVLPAKFGRLFVRGTLPPDRYTYLTVVGSRSHGEYGKTACEELVRSLAGLPVVIVSGLALGIDSIAHRTAIENGICTIAVPGSGLDPSVLYPATHANLAHAIIRAGGALVSPFPPTTRAARWLFPLRNRLMAALSHAVLVIEAEKRSGTLITARHALDFGRDVLAVPGSIFSSRSAGSHWLIRSGATPITSGDELREALKLAPAAKITRNETSLTATEREILRLLEKEPLSADELHERIGGDVSEISCAISALEILGAVAAFLGKCKLCRPGDETAFDAQP